MSHHLHFGIEHIAFYAVAIALMMQVFRMLATLGAAHLPGILGQGSAAFGSIFTFTGAN